MEARWPIDLPQCPTYGGYREGKRAFAAVFTPDVGDSITRRRGTTRIRVVQVTFQMSGAQVDAFERFVEDEIADGTLPYRWVCPRRKTDRRWKMDIVDGQDSYTISPAEGRAHDLFDVTFVAKDVGA